MATATAFSGSGSSSGNRASANRARFHCAIVGLVAVGVPAAAVDRAEHRGRVVGVHERARAVVDRLPGDRHVVGVHHPVDEPDELPAGDERGLAVRDRAEELQVLPRGVDQLRVVAVDRVVGQRPQGRLVPSGRRVLERPDPDVAGGHAGQDRPPPDRLPVDRLAGGDDREAPRGGDAEGGHGLADDVLAEHRPEGGPPVAAAREPRPPRPLELDVDEPAGRRAVLAQQDGPAVAEHGEVAELVPGVGLGDRPGAGRQVLAGEQGRGGLRRDRAEVEAEFVRQPVVEDRHPRLPHPNRRRRDEQGVRQPSVGVVEPPADFSFVRDRRRRSAHPLLH